jgi:Leucine-rich repeat (LRR) protein
MEPITTITSTVNFPRLVKVSNEYRQANTADEIEKFRNSVKTHVLNNGSLYAVICSPDNTKTSTEGTSYYCEEDNCETRGYHAISIVGWDDNYSRNNFNSKKGNKPKKDGAYIVLNSWGTWWGDDGYFYVSYEDVMIDSWLSGVGTSVETDSADKTYKVSEIRNKAIRNSVIEKLSNTFIRYNGEDYVTKLALDSIYALDLSNMNLTNNDLDGFEIFSNLCYLNLSDNNITDVSRLSDINNSAIDLSGNKNITNYNKLKNLYSLNLSNCDIKKLEDLTNIKYLYSLDISNNLNIDYENQLPLELCNLNLSNNAYTELSSFSKYKMLDYLNIANNNLTSLKGLEKTTINSLDVSNNNITDYSALKNMSLYRFIGHNCEITDISIFNNYNIIELDLANNNITDVSQYKNPNVVSIDLSNNKNLTGFSVFSEISVLTLKNNNMTDIGELSSLSGLFYLDLSNNTINDITILNDLKNLEYLVLADNKQIEKSVLSSDNLNYLDISNCDIDNSFDSSKLKNLNRINISNNHNYTNIIGLIKTMVNLNGYAGIEMENMVLTEKEIKEIDDLSKIYSISLSNVTVIHDTKITGNYIEADSAWLKKILMRNALNDGLLIENGSLDVRKLRVKVDNIYDSQVEIINVRSNILMDAKLVLKFK